MKIIKWLFILSGAKFYLNWILPTNPSSKNPLIRYIYGWNKIAFSPYYPKWRIIYGLILILIHTIGYVICVSLNKSILVNLLVNVYPIIIQLYIISRLYPIMLFKEAKLTLDI